MVTPLEEWLFAPLQIMHRDLERIDRAIEGMRNPEKLVERDLLTPTEHEVLRLAAEGLSNPEIAGRLGITAGTVRVNLSDIRRRLGGATREEAVAAFGKPTVRERLPITELRRPRVTFPPYERRADTLFSELLPLVDEIERSPSLERIGRLERQLQGLRREVVGARALTSGIEAEKFTDLIERLSEAINSVGLVRDLFMRIERETLPMRIETARHSFLSAIRVLRENLTKPAYGRYPDR